VSVSVKEVNLTLFETKVTIGPHTYCFPFFNRQKQIHCAFQQTRADRLLPIRMFFKNIIGFVFVATTACKAAELRGSQDLTDLDRAAICKNTAHRGAIDRGCTENLPLCVSSKGRFLPLRHSHGGMCARCVNLPRKWPNILWR